MKNLKNTLAAMGLMTVLGFGATTTNAAATGDYLGRETKKQCSVANNNFLGQFAGMIMFGMSGIMMPEMLNISDESCGTNETPVSESIVPKGFRAR